MLIRAITIFIFLFLVNDINGKRFGSSKGGSKGGSRGSSSGGSSGWGWFGSSSSKTSTVTKTSSTSNTGFVKPPDTQGWNKAPGTGTIGSQNAKPAGSYGWTVPNQNKPVGNTQYNGWKKAPDHSQPSSNIGPGGYPVQGGVQRNPPPYSPPGTGTNYNSYNRASPPAYNHPPAYSARDPMGKPPSYNSNYNTHYHTTNNYYYAKPSSYGMSRTYYPRDNNYGYPPGHFSQSYRYNGMGVFSSAPNYYGYRNSGSWGLPSYGSGGSSTGSLLKGVAIGAVTGYLASSLINRISNPWGYSGYGYGHGYMDRYRRYEYNSQQPTPPPPPKQDESLINCIAYDLESKSTLINPNCTCTFMVLPDPVTGQNNTHHNCVPKYIKGFLLASNPDTAVQTSVVNAPPNPNQAYGVNNPPPGFNGAVGPGAGSGSYGSGYGYGDPQQPQPPQQQTGNINKTGQFYSELERVVNMGSFN